MSEETIPQEETTPTEATTPQAETPKAVKPEPKPIKVQVVYRLPNGEWDDFVEGEPIDKTSFYKIFERQMMKDGELIAETEFDEDGNEVQKTLNTFNEQGKITYHELFNEGTIAEKMHFEYDEKNRLVKEVREFDEGFPLTTIFTYDDQDRVIYSTSKSIVVLSPAVLQGKVKGIYDGMLSRLKAGNVQGALSAFTGSASNSRLPKRRRFGGITVPVGIRGKS